MDIDSTIRPLAHRYIRAIEGAGIGGQDPDVAVTTVWQRTPAGTWIDGCAELCAYGPLDADSLLALMYEALQGREVDPEALSAILGHGTWAHGGEPIGVALEWAAHGHDGAAVAEWLDAGVYDPADIADSTVTPADVWMVEGVPRCPDVDLLDARRRVRDAMDAARVNLCRTGQHSLAYLLAVYELGYEPTVPVSWEDEVDGRALRVAALFARVSGGARGLRLAAHHVARRAEEGCLGADAARALPVALLALGLAS